MTAINVKILICMILRILNYFVHGVKLMLRIAHVLSVTEALT